MTIKKTFISTAMAILLGFTVSNSAIAIDLNKIDEIKLQSKVENKLEIIKITSSYTTIMSIVDSNGRFLGLNDKGVIEEKIPNSKYSITNNNQLAILDDGNYTAKFSANPELFKDGKEVFTTDIELKKFDKNDSLSKTVNFLNIKVFPKTILTYQIDIDTLNGTIIADDDNDSKPDRIIESSNKTAVEKKEILPAGLGLIDIENHWANESIYSLYTGGIINGYEDYTIRPDKNINRSEAVITLMNAIGEKGIDNPEFTFIDKGEIPKWSEKLMASAIKKLVLSGYDDNEIKPLKNISRQESLVIIMKGFGFEELKDAKIDFKDNKDISQWSLGFVSQAIKLGIVKGYQDNTFRPNNEITRAEFFVMVESCVNYLNEKR